jgi:hypothetical protein
MSRGCPAVEAPGGGPIAGRSQSRFMAFSCAGPLQAPDVEIAGSRPSHQPPALRSFPDSL